MEIVKNFNYFGITLDHRLNFTEHSNNIQKKVNQFTAFFYRLLLKVPHTIRVNKTYVQQVIQYGDLVYCKKHPTAY